MGSGHEIISNRKGASVYMHTSEDMSEVPDKSAKLVIGASVYLGKGVPWSEYKKLYDRVYTAEVWRVLRSDGYFVVIQTDAYEGGVVTQRNVLLKDTMRGVFEAIDTKIWKRKKADFFQPSFSQVWVYRRVGTKTGKPSPKNNTAYFAGVWDYPQTAGGKHNAYPEGLCRLLIDTFTAPGDLIVDPFAGTAKLLGIAARTGRRATGYEIDDALIPTIKSNLGIIEDLKG